MKTLFQPQDARFEQRVRALFARQGLMNTLAAELTRVDPGDVELSVPYAHGLSQQDGFLHAGAVIAAMDSACGYAALTLMPAGLRVMTVEMKVSMLAPADGERLAAGAEVMRSGRTLTFCRGDAYAVSGSERRHVATILATMIARPLPA